MPTYEYACAKCGERFDVYQSFTDEPLKKHNVCGGKLTKVFGPVGIVLKGAGFYKTDNRSSSTVNAAKKDSESASAGSGSGESAPSSAPSDSGSSTSSDSSSKSDSTSPSSDATKSDTSKKAEPKPSAKSKSA